MFSNCGILHEYFFPSNLVVNGKLKKKIGELKCPVFWSLFNPIHFLINMDILHTLLVHFIRCWQGESVKQSRVSFVCDHFLYPGWPWCVIQRWYCEEKLDACHCLGSEGWKHCNTSVDTCTCTSNLPLMPSFTQPPASLVPFSGKILQLGKITAK